MPITEAGLPTLRLNDRFKPAPGPVPALCDVGRSTPGRAAMMLLGAAAIASAFVAARVSNSQPGRAAVARYGAMATAAGVGTQISSPPAGLRHAQRGPQAR